MYLWVRPILWLPNRPYSPAAAFPNSLPETGPQSRASPCLRTVPSTRPAQLLGCAWKFTAPPVRSVSAAAPVSVVAGHNSPSWSRSQWWGVGWVGFGVSVDIEQQTCVKWKKRRVEAGCIIHFIKKKICEIVTDPSQSVTNVLILWRIRHNRGLNSNLWRKFRHNFRHKFLGLHMLCTSVTNMFFRHKLWRI